MKNLLLASCLIIGMYAFGQEERKASYIEVRGKAEEWIVPDEIYLQMTIVADKVQDFEDVEEKAVRMLLKKGVLKEDITLSDAQGEVITAWFKKGMDTKRVYQVKTNSAEMVNDVVSALDKLGVHQVGISKVDYSKKKALEDALRVKAMKDAKEKAVLMLSAIDAVLGSPLVVTENSWGMSPVVNTMMMRAVSFDNQEMKSSGSKGALSFKKLKYQSEVMVRFAIAED